MGFSVTKDGPYFSSGSISFSQLRSTFGGSGPVSLSGYLRDPNPSTTSPRVPDATENVNIPTSRSVVSVSKYRNAIKQYFVTQSGTDNNANLHGSPNWNSNLTKNVPKTLYITGTCGSTTIGSYAATFNATAYNLIINVSGQVLGAGGDIGFGGGTQESRDGKPGGPALYVYSSGNAIVVVPRGPIYGGGGGGAKGINGNAGSPGTCYYYTYYETGNQCGGCPGCGGDTRTACWGVGGCNCGKRGCSSTQYRSQCRRTVYYGVPGAPGGIGGDGGRGQGYQWSRTGGAGGTGGTPGGCPNYGSPGDPGQPGGSGADWGGGGETVYRYGRQNTGGPPGRGISGGNYRVDNGTYGGSASYVRGGY